MSGNEAKWKDMKPKTELKVQGNPFTADTNDFFLYDEVVANTGLPLPHMHRMKGGGLS